MNSARHQVFNENVSVAQSSFCGTEQFQHDQLIPALVYALHQEEIKQTKVKFELPVY